MKRAKLQRLRDQVHALQRVAHERPADMGADLPGILAELQRSLSKLQVDGAAPTSPVGAGTAPSAPGRQGRLRSMAERSPLLVRAVGRGTNCRWVNRSWSAFTGRSVDATLGDGWLQDVHADDRARCATDEAGARDGQDFRELEYRLRRAQGGFAWVHEHRVPRLTALGEVAGYLATLVDVSASRHAELHQDLVYAAERALAQDSTVAEDTALVLALLCGRLEWDVGELWSCAFAHEEPRCLKRWTSDGAATPESAKQALDMTAFGRCVDAIWVDDIALDERFADSSEVGGLALHGMLRLPVPMQGPGQASLRLYSREVRAQDDAVIAVAASVAARLGHALERRRTTGQAMSSVPRKAAILEALPDAVITIEPAGRVVELNAAANELFRFLPGQALGQPFEDLVVPSKERKRFQERWQQQAKQRRGHMGARFDAPALRADGTQFPAQFAMATLSDREPPCITICVWDVTERKLAEDAVAHYRGRVQSLMADLLVAEERERKRLARDLHDGLSQTIALAQIKLSALRSTTNGTVDGPLGEVQELMGHANRAARSIGFELSPLVLHDLGLEPALQWLAENIHERYGIAVEVQHDGTVTPADETTRVIVFRAIRELVINAAKHAGVHSVRVHLEVRNRRLRATVMDDGVGMEPGAALSEGFGLLSIRERMAHIGGKMSIDSTRGTGTKISLSAPLRTGKPKDSRTELR